LKAQGGRNVRRFWRKKKAGGEGVTGLGAAGARTGARLRFFCFSAFCVGGATRVTRPIHVGTRLGPGVHLKRRPFRAPCRHLVSASGRDSWGRLGLVRLSGAFRGSPWAHGVSAVFLGGSAARPFVDWGLRRGAGKHKRTRGPFRGPRQGAWGGGNGRPHAVLFFWGVGNPSGAAGCCPAPILPSLGGG